MAEQTTTSRRDRLLAAATALLDEAGPAAVTTRRLAQRADTTTMSVYSEFGSLGGVVRAVVDEGFTRLGEAFAAIRRTDDPVCDLLVLGATYRDRALAQPSLYAVMFGTAPLGGYRRSGDELVQGIETFAVAVDLVSQAMKHERMRPGDAFRTTAQLWSALHGELVLEMSGMLDVAGPPMDAVLLPLFTALIIGLGDEPERTHASITEARRRLGHLETQTDSRVRSSGR
jgi:AcrR family transcriptional regulator